MATNKVKLPNEVTSKALAVTGNPSINDTDQGKSAKSIMGEIKQIEKIFSASTYERIAKCAARIVVHAVKYGDVSLATHLTNALGTGWRNNDMRAWFEKFGPFTWGKTEAVDKNGEKVKGFKLNKEKRKELEPRTSTNERTAEFLGELVSNPMWQWKKETPYKGFDLMQVIEAAIRKAEAVKEKPIPNPKDNITGIEEGRALLAQIKAKRAREEAERMAKVEEVAASA